MFESNLFRLNLQPLDMATTSNMLAEAQAEKQRQIDLQNAYTDATLNASSLFSDAFLRNRGSGTTSGDTGAQKGANGLNPAFWGALSRANADMKAAGLGTFTVSSGYRSTAEQARLYAKAVKEGRTKYVARPGRSKHQSGVAADLNLTRAQHAWLAKNAARYGIRQPMSYESWHWQPIGV